MWQLMSGTKGRWVGTKGQIVGGRNAPTGPVPLPALCPHVPLTSLTLAPVPVLEPSPTKDVTLVLEPEMPHTI